MKYKSPDYPRYYDLQASAVEMVRRYLLEEIYPDVTPQQLAEELGISRELASRICTSPTLTTSELIYFLDLSKLNFGLFIRDPGSNLEVSFLPANNLHEESSFTSAAINKNAVDYSPAPNPVTSPVSLADGSYNLEENEDPGTDAEFQEIASRDLEEMLDNQCENCLEAERLEGSLLCYFCSQAGVLADSLDALEVVAHVDSRANQAQKDSRRLLEQANLLLTSSRVANTDIDPASFDFQDDEEVE